MQIVVNGQKQDVPENASVASLLQAAGLSADRVAVELNRRLIRADKYESPLHEGDEVEIVTFVGGG